MFALFVGQNLVEYNSQLYMEHSPWSHSKWHCARCLLRYKLL